MRAAVALAVAALAVAGCGGSGSQSPDSGGSTVAATWHDPDGDGFLTRGPGEPLRDRTDLARAIAPTRTLATFAILTDVHVRDEESPARVPFLDRLGGPFSSTFRPQEALSSQVLDAAVRSVNAARPDAVLVTGDLIDNAQANELALARTVLDGGRADPDSGARGYQGVQAATDPDPAYYRPDVDPPRHPRAARRRPAALPRARAAERRGTRCPATTTCSSPASWPARPRPPRSPSAASASSRPTPGSTSRRSENALTPQLVDSALSGGLPGTTARVAPDPARRELTPQEAVAGLRAASGHGGTGARMDYAFDAGRDVRVIVLDTVRRDVGSGGVLSAQQAQWLSGSSPPPARAG